MEQTKDWDRMIEFIKISRPDLFEKVKSACEEIDAEVDKFRQFLYSDFIKECGKAYYELSHRGDVNCAYEDLSDEERKEYEHNAEMAVIFNVYYED